MRVYRFLIYILYLLISTIRDNEGSTPSYVICDTKECRDTASKVKNKLNLTVDPCDNFYEFACGGWKANNPAGYPRLKNEFLYVKEKVRQKTKAILVEPQKEYSTVAFKYAKDIYNLCVNLQYDHNAYSRELTALDTFSQRFGVWPITLSLSEWSTMEDNVTWQDMIGKMHDNFFENGLFTVGLVPIHQHRLIYIGKVQNFFSNKLSAMYENFNSDIRKKNIYRRFIENNAKYIAQNRESNINMTMLTEDARNIMDFEINLRKEVEDNKLINQEIMDLINSRGLNTSNNYVMVHELQQIYNLIVNNSKKTELNWQNFLQRTFGPLGFTISPYDIVQIPSWSFFSHLVSLLERTPIRTIVNFIQWTFIRERIGYTSIEMEGFYEYFFDSIMELYQIRDRWEDCLDMLISECSSIFPCMNFDAAISYIYTERYERPEDKKNIKEMITDIVYALREQINVSTWMDEKSKKESIDKLNFMTPYVNNWYSKEEIDQLYKNLIITPESGYLDNVLKVQIDIRKTYLSLLWKPFQEKLPLPLAVSTFSNVNGNSVYFPIGIIEDPFQNATRPIAMNYGAIGQLIGQEINHGFDTFGFYKDGSRGNIWTPESKNKYHTITQCFIDQFNSYEVPGLGVIYDKGNLTVDENMVDAAGLKAAFKAYKNKKTRLRQLDLKLEGLEEYNEDQLFFMSYAQTRCETKTPGTTILLYSQPDHSPYELKVRGTLSNMAEFSEAYKCSNKAKMNPVNKCVLWH